MWDNTMYAAADTRQGGTKVHDQDYADQSGILSRLCAGGCRAGNSFVCVPAASGAQVHRAVWLGRLPCQPALLTCPGRPGERRCTRATVHPPAMSALNESLATDPKHAHCFNLCVCGTIRMPNAAGAASPSSAATAAAGGDEFADAATANRVSQFARTAMRQKDHEVVIDVGKELATESEVLKSSQQTVQSIRRDIDAMKAQLQRAGLGMDKLMAIEGQFNTLVTTSLQQEQRLIDQKTATIQRVRRVNAASAGASQPHPTNARPPCSCKTSWTKRKRTRTRSLRAWLLGRCGPSQRSCWASQARTRG